VIAFEQNLRASAGTHHAVADLIEAGVVSGTQEEKNRQDYDGQLGAAFWESGSH
jgi:hypothetical protein